ncbi:MAG: Uma2 family endonuclease [Xanthomonadales bacterium]|nr:Uma2 family endonuclease [Xanthomonadales bacterium]
MARPRIKPGEFSYRDYLAWPENERWQLLDGVAYAMAPPSIAHQAVVFELARQLGNALEGKPCRAFTGPVGVRLPRAQEADAFIDTVFEPDLVVVCDPSKLEPRGIRGAPDLVIEVLSPSTASFDLVEKRQRYDRAGVRELWLIDPSSSVLTVYRQHGEHFDAPDIRRAEGEITLTALPEITLYLDFMSALREQPEPL